MSKAGKDNRNIGECPECSDKKIISYPCVKCRKELSEIYQEEYCNFCVECYIFMCSKYMDFFKCEYDTIHPEHFKIYLNKMKELYKHPHL